MKFFDNFGYLLTCKAGHISAAFIYYYTWQNKFWKKINLFVLQLNNVCLDKSIFTLENVLEEAKQLYQSTGTPTSDLLTMAVQVASNLIQATSQNVDDYHDDSRFLGYLYRSINTLEQFLKVSYSPFKSLFSL